MVWYSATHRSEFTTAAKVNPVALDLSAFAVTSFVASVVNAGLIPVSSQILIGLAIFYGGLVQLIAGVQAFRTGSTYGAAAFCSGGAFWLIYGLGAWQHLISSAVVIGYLLVGLAILYIWVFILALKTNMALILVTFAALLTFLAVAIGFLVGGSTWIVIGGWLGIITAVLAWYTALALLLWEMSGPFSLPIWPRG